MSKKSNRPLFIPQQENSDFPFDIKDLSGQIKPIDFFRMYNSLKMVIEKIVVDHDVQSKIQTNMDSIFRVFVEKEKPQLQQQKSIGRRNSQNDQKPDISQLIENLQHMGCSQKIITDKLRIHNNGALPSHQTQESFVVKKSLKEKVKQEQIIEKQAQHHEVYHSDNEKK